MKLLLLLFLSLLTLSGGSYDFDETRYIYSIDKTLEMQGKITFDNKGMHIDYIAPQERHIIYDGLSMDVVDEHGETLQHVNLDDQPMMKIYMDFIHKLYRGDYEALSENFKITKNITSIILQPIAPIDKVIKSVVVHHNDSKLEQIKTEMSSGDEITLKIKY